MRTFKKISITVLILAILGFLFVLWSDYKIKDGSYPYITKDLSKLPNEKVGLVLGTSKTLASGRKNLYFYYRMDAGEKLYKSGKVKYLILSGDNSHKNYSEPEDMHAELISRGIPADHIFLDYAGFRTLDSVVRAKQIFGQNSFIIVSQQFHNARAVFLARRYGINAYGYNAMDVNKYAGMKTKIREKFARAKVFVDLLLGVDPKFGGEKVQIP